MRNGSVYIAISILLPFNTFAQKPSSGDLSGAQKIVVNSEFSLSRSPKGYGNIKEFLPGPSRSRNFFKEERNTIWLSFEIPYSGILTFEITPFRKLDDYDWMLFKALPDLGQALVAGTSVPLRTNNSRNDPTTRSVTGLREGFTNLYTAPGPNPAFSKPVDAIKGERYYLVLDNIYENGQGFNLKLNLKRSYPGPSVVVEGYVRDKRNAIPLQADVVFEDDSTSLLISQTKTDSAGFYRVVLPASRPMNATAIKPGYLYASDELKLKTGESKKVDFLLDTITSGNKIIFFNIHFQPNKDTILPNSTADLERLVKLLRKETDWDIRIIGHSNNNVFADASYLQKLSFNRAISVKRFLVSNGISGSRISCSGMGGKSPLIDTKDPEEGLKNLRVEILLEKKS